MATDADTEFLIDALSGLCGPLHEDLEHAWESADSHFVDHEMTTTEYQTGQAHLARFHLRRLLACRDQLGAWELAPLRPNGQILLHHGLTSLRILREGDQISPIPPPGPNRARIHYYRNPDLNLFGVEASNLLGLWNISPATSEASVRIVRTTGHWKYARPARIDLDFVLPREAARLAELEFNPTDAGIALPLPFGNEEESDVDGTRW